MSLARDMPLFTPDRLDRAPVVLGGCTAAEIQYLFLFATATAMTPAIALGFIGGSWYVTIPGGLLLIFALILAGMKSLAVAKRGKPHNYYLHRLMFWMAEAGWIESGVLRYSKHYKVLR